MKNHVVGVLGVSCQALLRCMGLCGWAVVKLSSVCRWRPGHWGLTLLDENCRE